MELKSYLESLLKDEKLELTTEDVTKLVGEYTEIATTNQELKEKEEKLVKENTDLKVTHYQLLQEKMDTIKNNERVTDPIKTDDTFDDIDFTSVNLFNEKEGE